MEFWQCGGHNHQMAAIGGGACHSVTVLRNPVLEDLQDLPSGHLKGAAGGIRKWGKPALVSILQPKSIKTTMRAAPKAEWLPFGIKDLCFPPHCGTQCVRVLWKMRGGAWVPWPKRWCCVCGSMYTQASLLFTITAWCDARIYKYMGRMRGNNGMLCSMNMCMLW